MMWLPSRMSGYATDSVIKGMQSQFEFEIDTDDQVEEMLAQ